MTLRRTLALGATVLAPLLFSGTARADRFQQFQVSGTLSSGGAINGDLTFDDTSGEFTGLDVVGLSGGVAYLFTDLQGAGQTPGPYMLEAESLGLDAELVLFLPVRTLMGYDGSALCSESARCGFFGDESYLSATSLDFLAEGAVSATPEPGSLLLCASGAAVIMLFGCRRRSAQI